MVENFVDKVAYDVCNLENFVLVVLYAVSSAKITFSNKNTTYVLPKIISGRFHTSYVVKINEIGATYIVWR